MTLEEAVGKRLEEYYDNFEDEKYLEEGAFKADKNWALGFTPEYCQENWEWFLKEVVPYLPSAVNLAEENREKGVKAKTGRYIDPDEDQLTFRAFRQSQWAMVYGIMDWVEEQSVDFEKMLKREITN
tara:strand:+ start:3061 stop:3441 length:381 start_codon:yes stop_codon:yes gene_type:complete